MTIPQHANRNLCVAVGGPTMAEALSTLSAVAKRADLVELRLDLIERYDVARLLASSPCPAIVTLRPERQGGAYRGPEEERVARLRRAAEAGATWGDVELDAVGQLGRVPGTALIVSCHDFEAVPPEPERLMEAMWSAGADAVKLAAMVRQPSEVAALLRLLRESPGPAIVLGMGAMGVAGRILALREGACLLTYAAPDAGPGTAPGQVTLWQLESIYRARTIGADTSAIGYLGPAEHVDALGEANAELARLGLDAVCVPVGPVDAAQGLAAVASLELRGALAPPWLEEAIAGLAPSRRRGVSSAARVNTIVVADGAARGEWAPDIPARVRLLAPHLG